MLSLTWLPLSLALASAPCAAPNEVHKIDAPLGTHALGEPSIDKPLLSPDGEWVVTSVQVGDQRQVFSVRTDGSSAPVCLTPALGAGGFAYPSRIDSLSSRVVYSARQIALASLELYSVPIDGSAPAIQLSGPMVAGGNVGGVEITPDGVFVLYTADQLEDGRDDLFTVPIDGNQAPIRLSSGSMRVSTLSLTPQGSDAVFKTFDGACGCSLTTKIYRVHVDGTGGASLLASSASFVGWSAVSANGQRFLYLDANGLHTRPMLGSGSTLIDANASTAQLTPDGLHVVFTADVNGTTRLYSAPTDDGVPKLTLNGPLVSGGNVDSQFAISADSSRVIYRADQDVNRRFELFSVPVDGSASPVRLNGALVSGGIVQAFKYWLHSDGIHALYVADQELLGTRELYCAPLDGSQPAVKVSGTMVARGDVTDAITGPTGPLVVFRADKDADEVFEYYAASLDGTGSPVRLNPPMGAGQLVLTDGQITAQGELVYFASQAERGVYELFGVPAAGGTNVRLSPATSAGPRGDVLSYALSPDGLRGVFLVFSDDYELYSFSLTDPHAQPIRMDEGFVGPFYAITPDGARVVFGSASSTLSTRYFSRPLDGSAPAEELLPPEERVFTPRVAGGRAVFLATNPSLGDARLYSQVLGSGGPPTQLQGAMVNNGVVQEFALDASGTHVAFCANKDLAGVVELYVVPADGSSAPLKLGGPTNAALDAGQCAFTPDGAHVVYVEAGTAAYSLRCARTDGSQPYVELHTDRSAVTQYIGNTFVVYQTNSGLMRVDLAGGTPSVLNSGFPSHMKVAPDESQIVYMLFDPGTSHDSLYRCPLSGGAQVLLDAGFWDGSDQQAQIAISADSQHAVYLTRDAAGVQHVRGVALEGTPQPQRLDRASVAGGNVTALALERSGGRVFYVADSTTDERFELFEAYADGSRSARRISGTVARSGAVALLTPQPTAAGNSVFYISDAEEAGTLELYFTRDTSPAGKASANRPTKSRTVAR